MKLVGRRSVGSLSYKLVPIRILNFHISICLRFRLLSARF
jgi:hypothetical protein